MDRRRIEQTIADADSAKNEDQTRMTWEGLWAWRQQASEEFGRPKSCDLDEPIPHCQRAGFRTDITACATQNSGPGRV